MKPQVMSRGWSYGTVAPMPGDRARVNIMRPGPWGNPFKIGVHGDRAEVLRRYEAWLRTEYELLQELWRLKDCHLVCCCAPAACHGDLLLRLAAMTPEQLMDWMLGFEPLDDL